MFILNSCAQLRWLAASGRFEDGRKLGCEFRRVAAELGINAHGVRYHLRKLLAKLGVGTRVEAVRRARELDLIPVDS